MLHPAISALGRYSVAVLTVMAAVLVTLCLPPLHAVPFLWFVVAVLANAWYGGVGPALVAVSLSVLAVDYFFLPGFHAVNLGVNDLARDGTFALVAALVIRFARTRRRAERALRDQAARLQEADRRKATELAAMTRLQEISCRFLRGGDMGTLLEEVLDAAILVTRADMGMTQLLDPRRGALEVLVQRGFGQEFVDYCNQGVREGELACGAASKAGARVVVEDVRTDPIFVGRPGQEAVLAAGIRAVQSTPLMSRSGQILGLLSTQFGEAHRPTEDELRLVDVLVRQASDLIDRSRAEEALRESDRRQDEFLATLAHELRNPPTPIRSAVDVLCIEGTPEGELRWARAVIDRQVEQRVRLVDDLLDITRITRGKIELRKQRTELAAAVETAVESSRPLVEAGGHELRISLPPRPVFLEAEATRLAQVLMNLLNNAAKFTPPEGRIWLTAEEREGADAAPMRTELGGATRGTRIGCVTGRRPSPGRVGRGETARPRARTRWRSHPCVERS